MKMITDMLKEKRPLYSFEFFPPKTSEGETKLFSTVQELSALKPDFVSVTYGAGGSTRDKTRSWVETIQNRYGIPAMAHFTCVGSSRAEIRAYLEDLSRSGIRNIMALRGDPPKGETSFKPAPDGLAHGSEMIAFIRQTGLPFALGGAAYPEVHPEAISPEDDLVRLREKVKCGADFLVTQLFFDNSKYFSFIKKADVAVPVVPGIMPITAFQQVERFTKMAGCSIPQSLLRAIADCGEDTKKLLEVSLAFTEQQCRELLDAGAPGIHFYTLNQSHATMEILERIRR
ncbi:MAG TPA: methylenetetrahydrofolate reductase [NAD(P)H] [Leptospiraceae bacterium]|nr:methylenetetrahydrofolate reductase [NAD(P)H] [Leptospirales bacterium]HMX57313.1 methylenetetrahydrofolate reductase [NAD(P)H] [Leptospiraceae bacterium]HMY47351.1 methylenetetrahydrofolate reductase [NAD(P)H] [Leptospiraceae bacterium]HNE22603.1 methylenetetrahydrofolate reductase [NAD(P)H] [Leptospiraceae bacterium]HNL69190.1 methylenetetrahydrofolate reductase [NAD(P)H] [Leptospiraceae bacterium]